MRRYCLSVGIFLGLLAPSYHPLAAAETPSANNPGQRQVENLNSGQVENLSYDDVPLVAATVRQAMQDRNFAEARKAIDEAAKAQDAPSDYLAYLKGWSFQLDNQPDQAIAALEKFEKDFPQSPWLRRARFAKAQAMVAKHDFRGAQAIYEHEAKYLLSAARREQAAAVYLEFADARFQPRRQDQKPDYNMRRSSTLWPWRRAWRPAHRAEAQFRLGVCWQKLGNQIQAVKAYQKFLATYADDPRIMEARYHLGECLLAAGNLPESRKQWRELVKTVQPVPVKPVADGTPQADGTRSVPAALPHDWLAEAAFHIAETWHCPQPDNDEDLQRGVAALQDFLSRFPTHELAGRAHLRIAESQLHRGHEDQAVATLQQFLQDPRWKDCKELPEARLARARSITGKRNTPRPSPPGASISPATRPTRAGTPCSKRSSTPNILIGQDKFKAGDDDAAAKLLAEFMDRYPLDARNPGILFLFGQMHQRQKKWEAAIADWQRLATKYPQTEEASRAEFSIARTLEEELHRYDEARQHYALVAGRDKAAAQQARAAISAKAMQVSTERVFLSTETPQVKLATRNVPSVKVRVYKIDLETYFRKMHSIAGIQRWTSR